MTIAGVIRFILAWVLAIVIATCIFRQPFGWGVIGWTAAGCLIYDILNLAWKGAKK